MISNDELEKVYGDLSELTIIYYLVPHPEQVLEQASPLQGFTPDVIQAASAYWQIANLPKNVIEFVVDHKSVLAGRIAGHPYYIIPVEVSRLQEAFNLFQPTICCIWSINPEIAESVDEFIKQHDRPVFHVSPLGTSHSISYQDVTRATLKEFVLKILEYWKNSNPENELVGELIEKIVEKSEAEPILLEIPKYNHLVFNPNEVVLQSAGFKLKETNEPFTGDNSAFFDHQRDLIEQISRFRDEIFKEKPFARHISPYDLILTAPSIIKEWRKLENIWRDFPKDVRQHLRSYLKKIVGRKTFVFLGSGTEASAAVTNEYLNGLIGIHRDEMDAYTSALCVRASANFVPVIRIPTAVNNVYGDLIQLETAFRAGTPNQRNAAKVSKTAKRVSEQLIEGLPEWLIEKLKQSDGVKLISDAPLEWMNIDGFPLTLTTDVSRIPTTPGNQFFWQTAISQTLPLRSKHFDEILVLRAFKETDHIKNHLKTIIEMYRPNFKDGKPDIKYVDIQTETDLIQAFEKFSGVMAIYDGHGTHSSRDDIGTLQLPSGAVSAWSLREKVQVPPIIVLSACDTHPFSASHATTVNGFLAAGARTVIGTSLPVDARASAEYVARLIFRISRYVSIHFSEKNAPMKWSRLVTGLQRRHYMTELLFAIGKKAQIKIDDKLLLDLSIKIGTLIDDNKKDWLTQLIKFLAQNSHKLESKIIKIINEEAFLNNSLLHVQFGNPEHILLLGE